MALHKDWRRIVRRAWSMRLMTIAAVLTGCEAILPLFSDVIPRNLFASLTMIAIVGGMLARVISQQGFDHD